MPEPTAKILIVDDNPTNIQVIEALLSDQPFQFVSASSGQDALEAVETMQPDLILLDIAMPGMDGVEVCKRMRAMPICEDLPILFVTAMGGRLEDAFAAGGSDFVTKPVNREELLCRMRAHLQIRSQMFELQELNNHLQRERDIAQYVMESIVQGNVYPDNLRVFHKPQNEFSGDLIMTAEHPEQGLYLLVADFTGHGLAAAIGTVPASLTFRSMTKQGVELEQLAIALNRALLQTVPDTMFCAAIIARLEPGGERIHLWQGGMPDLYHAKPDQSVSELPSRHMALSAEEDDEFDASTICLELAPGDRLYFLSDGIIEAFNPQQDMFGEARLKEVITQHGSQCMDLLPDIMEKWREAEPQDDDLTLVELTGGTR